MMSDAAAEQDAQAPKTFRTPEQEQAAKGADVPGAYEMPLKEINPLNAHLFKDNRWQEHFERLRAEDPVHFNQIESAGRYWSLTKYADIKKVDADWQNFLSTCQKLLSTWAFRLASKCRRALFRGARRSLPRIRPVMMSSEEPWRGWPPPATWRGSSR